jgi:hypothetical protein
MVQILFVAVGAGAAAALLFASIVSGSLLAFLLFYLAPLPILIAALGWSHLAGLVAAISAAAALGLVFGPMFSLAFMIGIGLPAWWLGYLALLARPGDQGLEWYPVGRLVVWTALLGTLIAAIGVLNIGTDADSFHAALKNGFESILRLQTRTPADAPLQIPGVKDVNAFLDLLVLTMPPAFAVLATLTSVVNLWLAGKIVKVSGRLKRPWPNIPDMRFPAFAGILLAAAIILSFFSGLLGIVGGILAACLLMAYAVLGFAVLHAITRDVAGRALMLAGVYAAILLVTGWPILLMTLLGLADTALDIRGRMARKRGPPTLRT